MTEALATESDRLNAKYATQRLTGDKTVGR